MGLISAFIKAELHLTNELSRFIKNVILGAQKDTGNWEGLGLW